MAVVQGMRHLRVPLRVVFYKDGPDWLAHCLEFDLIGEGAEKTDALDRLVEAIALQVEASAKYGNPQNLFKPADGRIFAMFAAGRDVTVGNLDQQFDGLIIQNAVAREFFEPAEKDAQVTAST